MINNIFDRTGKKVGYTVDRDRRVDAFSALGKYLGYYLKRTDQTWDAHGKLISQSGNMLGALLFECFKNRGN
jgi:hypothetical protein